MKILLVEDDERLSRSLARLLEQDRHNVEVAADGETGLEIALGENGIDVVVLDIGLPDISGLEVARRIRRDKRDLAILMLTARDTVGDRVTGLDTGADDYVVKPFALDELFARLRALLRRAVDGVAGDVLQFADLVLVPGTREVWRADRPLDLTRTEFSLLELFLRNPRQVLTRSLIFERVWGYDFGAGSNSLDVYIGYLRRKTEAAGESRLIQTVRGVGYALREP
jgi:two-component system, OmpR family, response regulator MprA